MPALIIIIRRNKPTIIIWKQTLVAIPRKYLMSILSYKLIMLFSTYSRSRTHFLKVSANRHRWIFIFWTTSSKSSKSLVPMHKDTHSLSLITLWMDLKMWSLIYIMKTNLQISSWSIVTLTSWKKYLGQRCSKTSLHT